MLAPIPINTVTLALAALANIIPQGLPTAPEQIAVPQDGILAVTTLAPAPENAGPAASTTTINTPQKLGERRYARTEKMRPGLGCTVRYVC